VITTTEAVVLRSMKFRDTSKIVSLYTRLFGRVSVVAKGARDRKSRFGAALEPMSHVSAVFYKKERSDLHLLSQCDILCGFRRIADDMDRMAAGLGVVELVSGVTHDEEANEELFTLLIATLAAIENATKGAANALYYFEVRLARLLGFQTGFQRCLSCGNELDERISGDGGVAFQIDRGGCLCAGCRQRLPGGRRLTMVALRILQHLERLETPASALTIVMPREVAMEVGEMLHFYLRSHVEGLRDSRTERVFTSLG
jgi:DNA repair protein RecO (recombination protein O)